MAKIVKIVYILLKICGCGSCRLIWCEATASYVLRLRDLRSEYDNECDFITDVLLCFEYFCEMYVYT